MHAIARQRISAGMAGLLLLLPYSLTRVHRSGAAAKPGLTGAAGGSFPDTGAWVCGVWPSLPQYQQVLPRAEDVVEAGGARAGLSTQVSKRSMRSRSLASSYGVGPFGVLVVAQAGTRDGVAGKDASDW